MSSATSSDAGELLRSAARLLECKEVAIRCWCDALEVVYVEFDGDRLVATDRGEAYQYFSRADDTTYDASLLTDELVRSICERHGVVLAAGDSESYARFEREIGSGDEPAEAVTAVAAALDEVHTRVMRADLRS